MLCERFLITYCESIPGLFSVPYPLSIYPSPHVQNKLLLLIIYLAGAQQVSPPPSVLIHRCANTSAGLLSVEPGSSSSQCSTLLDTECLDFMQCFVQLWKCNSEDRCWFWPPLMCGMDDCDRSAAEGLWIASSWPPSILILMCKASFWSIPQLC